MKIKKMKNEIKFLPLNRTVLKFSHDFRKT